MHCFQNEVIDLDLFTIYQNNRKVNPKNRRSSGGIAVAIPDSVLEIHIVTGGFKGIDGQLGLRTQKLIK